MAAPVLGTEIDLDDDELARVVRRAQLPPLLTALAHATGDLSILRADLRCDPTRVRESQGGLTTEQREAARALAVEVLGRMRDRPAPAGDGDGDGDGDRAHADPELLQPLMDFVIGERVSDDYVHLLLEELSLTGDDLRAPDWHKDAIDPDRDLLVVIVGAGMSGIAAAHRLQQAGVDYVILEKNDDVGGTWFENRYPGCRVDVPNHLYSYSFAQRDDWPQQFSPQVVLQQYFRAVADDLGITPHIRFGTEVLDARWRDDDTWELSLRDASGKTETLVAHVLVSAVGQLNRPKLPDIPGRESFGGPSFHSAQWDHDVDLEGKRVAVIGTGASAIQIVPAIAEAVEELLVFQRTPNWMMPTPQYYAPMSDEMNWLMAHVPFYAQWYRFWLFWRLAEGALPAARVDPTWAAARDGSASVSRLNDELRAALTQYIELQFAETPELLPHVVPTYPPLAKRILLDNGIWASTLKRENVELVSDGIERITANGVVTTDGREHPVDVIAYATGFHASQFLMPMRVTGRDGADLHEHWRDDPHAFLGLTIAGFPNLFCLYGPNTNLVANGSIIFFSECAVRYIVEGVHLLLERGARSLELERDVYDAEHARVEAANARMAWGVSSVNSWYKNAQGRVTQNWPFTLLEYWDRTRRPDPEQYALR